MRLLKAPLSKDNPVTVQVLGICSLAVTVKLKPAIVMALAVTIVVGFSNLITSALRKTITQNSDNCAMVIVCYLLF